MRIDPGLHEAAAALAAAEGKSLNQLAEEAIRMQAAAEGERFSLAA